MDEFEIVLKQGDDVRVITPKYGDIIIVTGTNGAMIAQMISKVTLNGGGPRVPIVVMPGGDLGALELTTLKRLKADIQQFEFEEAQRGKD